MQKDIVNAQVVTDQLKDKLSNQKENVVLKAQALARLTKLVEQQRDYYEEISEEHKAKKEDLVSCSLQLCDFLGRGGQGSHQSDQA